MRLRLLWVHDSEGFTEYQDMTRPVMDKHGSAYRTLAHDGEYGRNQAGETGNRLPRGSTVQRRKKRSRTIRSSGAAAIGDEAVKLVAITAHSVYGD